MIDSLALVNIARGESAPPGTVSIVLPHYETAALARLCLRAIRRFSNVPFEVIVVDNGSADGESLDYLQRVAWIRLIERPRGEVPQAGPPAHAEALNLGLAAARGEFLLVMHTDTIARRDGWLGELRRPFLGDARLAVLGADKIDAPGPLRATLKALAEGQTYLRLAYRLLGRPAPEALRPRPPHARSFCALYRRQALVDEKLDFLPRRGPTAGEDVYHELLSRGYRGLLLPAERMRELVLHVSHATAYLSPGREIHRGRVRRRTARRLARLFAEPWARQLLDDDSLDE